MSLVYLVLMVAVSAALLFVVGDAVLLLSRKPAWQTPQDRLAAEGATLHYLPKAAPAAPVAVPQPAAVVAVREEEAVAA